MNKTEQIKFIEQNYEFSSGIHSSRRVRQNFFEKIETEAEKAMKETQIKLLKASIERREKLLSNENYVNKAPKKIVDMDKQKLQEEKNKLEELTK